MVLWSDCAEGLSDPCISGSRKRTLRERYVGKHDRIKEDNENASAEWH